MTRRLVLALLVVSLGAAACGGGDAAPPATGDEPAAVAAIDQVIVLELEDGGLVGGVRREDVDLGAKIELRVEGATDEQVHVHGYDLYVEPEGDGVVVFDALIPGRFEVEFEESGRLLIEMTVS